MKEELTEEQKQFLAEYAALKRSIRNNHKSRRFPIFVLVVLWAAVVLDVIRAFTMPGELTLKHIAAQNTLHFQCLFAYIYTLWCCYIIPKGAEECQSAIGAFLKKWNNLFEGAENEQK
jgi:hypothetical protein